VTAGRTAGLVYSRAALTRLHSSCVTGSSAQSAQVTSTHSTSRARCSAFGSHASPIIRSAPHHFPEPAENDLERFPIGCTESTLVPFRGGCLPVTCAVHASENRYKSLVTNGSCATWPWHSTCSTHRPFGTDCCWLEGVVLVPRLQVCRAMEPEEGERASAQQMSLDDHHRPAPEGGAWRYNIAKGENDAEP
jgi:hypothetical protein